MHEEAAMRSVSIPAFGPDSAEWIRVEGGPPFDYPIDYWYRVIDSRPDAIRFVMRWEANSYCHFHRHVAGTTTLVLDGEHHVIETTPTQTVHKIRRPGHYTRNPAGDVHAEHGGPSGSMVLFAIEAGDGRLFEILDNDERVMAVATIDTLLSGQRSL